MARPAHRVVRRAAGARIPAALGLTLLAVVAAGGAACSRERVAVSDTATTGSRAPSPYVSEIPPWPAETSAYATDRHGGFSAKLRAEVPSCGDATPVVTADSVGPIYPGQPLPILLGACAKRLLLWHWDDGSYLPAVAVRLGDAIVVADLAGMTADDVVSRVVVIDGARTAEGIGPGSPLAAVQHAYGAPLWRRNQCTVDASFESRPGLLLRISIPEGGRVYNCSDIRRFAASDDYSRFPRGAHVEWVAAELGGAD